MLIKYLKELLGEDSIKGLELKKLSLPIYLRNYDFSLISVYNVEYVFVQAKEKLNIKSFKAQQAKIEDAFSCPSVLVLKESNTAQRKNLIENKIMFVEIGKQLFMPTIGVVLQKSSDILSNKNIERFTPQIQLCALFFLYGKEGQYSVKQLTDTTGLNEMAISRGIKILSNMGLISSVSSGRKKYYSVAVSKLQFWNAVEKYMISPIARKLIINKKYLPDCAVQAGYSALSEYSLLMDDDMPTYAVSRERFKDIEKCTDIMFEDLLYGSDYVNLQVWKYDPVAFADDGRVDKLSLCLSFSAEQDERTQSILEELKEEVLNG